MNAISRQESPGHGVYIYMRVDGVHLVIEQVVAGKDYTQTMWEAKDTNGTRKSSVIVVKRCNYVTLKKI